MSFNIFGPASKSDIRVGYIDPERGFVGNLSVYEANKYAKLNPGTTFIFRRRDKIRFMNINGVNALTPKDLLPSNSASGSDGCDGITGLDIYEDGFGGTGTDGTGGGTDGGFGGTGTDGTGGGTDGGFSAIKPEVLKEIPPKVRFSGGGGIGAKGNPIIGNDGSLLAVDLIDGGWGYQYAPITEVFDEYGIGSGAVVRSIMIGDPGYPDCKFLTTVETFENEEDFEEYDLSGAPTTGSFGRRYDKDGKDIGIWDPTVYANLDNDPARIEIQRYQDFLLSLRRGQKINIDQNVVRNWWTTRQERPIQVTARNKKSRVVHKVRHPGWNNSDENNKPREDTDYIDVVFNIYSAGANKRNLRFIFASEDGTEKFVIKADDFKDKKVHEVTKRIKKNVNYNVSSSGDKKDTGKEGKGVEQGLAGFLGKNPKEKNNGKKGKVIFADFRNTVNDNDDLQIECVQGIFTASNKDKSEGRSTFTLTYKFEDSRAYRSLQDNVEKSFMNRNAVSPVPPSNASGSDFAGIEHTMEWEEDFPYDGEYTFKYLADNVADFYLDNELIGRAKRFKGSPEKIKRFVQSGVHRIRIDLENIPIYTNIVKQREEKNRIPVEFEVYGQGSERHRQIKFAFTSEDGSHSFVLDNVQKSDSSYKKEINILRNTNYKVVAIADAAPEKVSDKKEYKIEFEGLNQANNPVFVSPGGKFIRLKDGDGDDHNATFKIDSTSPGIKAKFSDDASKLIVTGQSKGDVTLKLEWDDNPRTAGVAVKSIKIGDTKWIQSGGKGNVSRKININKISNTKSNSGVVEQGTVQKFKQRTKEKGNKPSKIAFADYVGSLNDNDDMQVKVSRGTFTALNKTPIKGTGPQGTQTRGTFNLTFRVDAKPELKGSVPASERGFETQEIFSTKEFIDKADRKLWRINPNAGRDADFLNKFGILPFNPQSNKSSTNDFAGTHVIRWEYVDFPVSGNYNIETMVDDDVTLFIGNRSGGGRMGIGNGLGDIETGGDEVIIRKKGFSGPGRSTGKSFETKYFDAGKYRIRAELKQVRGKPLSSGNPMALAVRIRATFKEKKVVSARSWNQNPMGAALVIDAPLPPIPQEPKPVSEGRCPNNPIWTTRFPGSKDRWFPVTLDERWSAFMNRYALSPIPPLSTPGSDNSGGQPYRTSWVIEAPYAGFYGLKGTVDNGGRILVDGNEIMSGGSNYPNRGLDGFRSKFPQTIKFPLAEGKHTIEVEVSNQITDTFEKVNKKVFDTRDWAAPAKTKEKEGNSPVTYIGLNRQSNDDTYPIRAEGASETAGRRVKDNGREIQFDDNAVNGFDENASLKIQSTSPGVTAKFSGDGGEMIVKGSGDVTLKFSWDDNPGTSGLAVGTLKVGSGEKVSFTAVQKGTKGSVTKTIKVGGGKTGTESNKLQVTNNGKKVKMRDGDGDDTNASFTIVAGDATFSNNGRTISGKGECTIQLEWDDNPNTAGVAVEQIKIEGVTWKQSGKRGKSKKTVKIGSSKSTGLESGSVKNGVSYSGPPISSYSKGFISPTIQDVNLRPNEEIQGKQWVMRWDNVDFPISGQYKIRTQVDDEVDVLIDGVKVQTAKIRPRERRSDPVRYQTFNATTGKKSVELRLRNIRIPNTGFQQNPVAVQTDIIVPIDVSTGLSRAWIQNPVGISAILIPPPCPKKVVGKGKICRIVVDDPGNGLPKPPTGGTGDGEYPVTLELEGIEVINPGINHNCGVDQVVIEPSNGAQLSYECDTFGRIIKVNVDSPTGSGVPPRGFTTTPDIRVITDTGTNFQAVPRLRVVRDPVGPDVEPEQILQVTDLVGLKQTGYVDGRAYYGSVFFKDNVRYAGIYETPGQLIQVYDTLQESIDAEITTPPSAIQRSGTDIRSNNPRLNIPGTPDSLT
jgi:hypothetical protein